MSQPPMLERSVLERKERDELHTIAEALGVKPGARTKKADLIQTILVAAGVEPAPEPGSEAAAAKPKRAPRAAKAAVAVEPAADEAGANGVVEDTGNGDADMAEALGVDDAIDQAIDEGQAPTATDEPDAGAPVASDEPRRNERANEARRNGAERHDAGNDRGGESRANGDGRPPQGGQPGQNGGQPQPQRQPAGAGGPQGTYADGGSRRSRRRRGRDGRGGDRDFRVQEQTAETQYQGELVPVSGLLDLTDQGYGYVRTKGYLPSSRDVYVSTSQAKRFALRKGDHVEGEARPPIGNEKFGALLRIESVSGQTVDEA